MGFCTPFFRGQATPRAGFFLSGFAEVLRLNGFLAAVLGATAFARVGAVADLAGFLLVTRDGLRGASASAGSAAGATALTARAGRGSKSNSSLNSAEIFSSAAKGRPILLRKPVSGPIWRWRSSCSTSSYSKVRLAGCLGSEKSHRVQAKRR